MCPNLQAAGAAEEGAVVQSAEELQDGQMVRNLLYSV